MWKITLVLNALLMAIFSCASRASQLKLTNQYIQYPHVGEGMPALPPISDLALRVQWLPNATAVIWALVTLALLAVHWQQQGPRTDLVQMHTSATLLLGMVMLTFFTIAGVYPYVSIIVHMR